MKWPGILERRCFAHCHWSAMRTVTVEGTDNPTTVQNLTIQCHNQWCYRLLAKFMLMIMLSKKIMKTLIINWWHQKMQSTIFLGNVQLNKSSCYCLPIKISNFTMTDYFSIAPVFSADRILSSNNSPLTNCSSLFLLGIYL